MKKGISRCLRFWTNPAVCCLSVIFLSVFAISGVPASAQTLTATHSFEPGTYVVGSNITVSTQIVYDGTLSALAVKVKLPKGWTYIGADGEDEPGARVGSDPEDVDFLWILNIPASPVDFTYTVKVPETAIGPQEISADVLYRRESGELVEAMTPDPLTVEPSPDSAYTQSATHSSDAYIPGSNLTVTNQITYTGFLSALGIRVELPDGWSYISHQGDDDPHRTGDASGYLEFSWIEVPATPVDFTYTLSVPPNEEGQQKISSTVLYRRTGGEYEMTPDPLYISPMVSNGYIEGTVSPNVPTRITTSGGGETWTTFWGTFSIPHAAGQFSLAAQAEGYDEYTTGVIVRNSEITSVNITLTPAVADTEPVLSIVSPNSDVSIYEGESADFYSFVTGGNAPLVYAWDFDGGATNSNLKDPGTVTFHTEGIYNVTFTVTDKDRDTADDTVKVTVMKAVENTVPVALISYPPSNMTIYKGESVNFQGGVTKGNAPFTYAWNFNSGAVNTNMEDPGNITFHSPGVYNVTFTVTDKDGDASSDSVRVTVQNIEDDTVPTISIMSPSPTQTIYEGESLNFQGTVSGGNWPFIYSWGFDGAASDYNMEDPGSVTFHTEGVYTVTFTVSEAYKIQDRDSVSVTVTVIKPVENTQPVASIAYPPSDMIIDEGGSVLFQGTVTDGNAPFTYLWEFDGAAANSNVEDPGNVTFHNTGVYDVTFTVTEADKPEDTDSKSVTITVLKPVTDTEPEVSVVSPLSDMTIKEGESVDFQGNVLNGNWPFTYSWDFGGGAANSALEDPRNVTFDTEGVYRVIFTVTDDDNDVDSDWVMITVNKDVPGAVPKVSISSPLSDMTVGEGESVNFQGTVSNGNAPFAYSWNFSGGAANSVVEDPGYVTFPAEGTYTVTFTVTDYDGDTVSDTVTVKVTKVLPSTPDVSIASPLSDMNIQAGESVNFQGTLTGGNAPFAYTWDFNGGAVNSGVEDPGDVTFETVGIYSVIFSVTDKDGDADSASLVITVSPEKIRGYMITSELRIGAVINTDDGPIEAVWKNGGEAPTAAGDRAVWGYFYADPKDIDWGSYHNPELFVKIWFDRSGRIDVNYFHVSVPDIEVYSDYPYNDAWDWQGTTTMETRYIRQYYYEDGQSDMEKNTEDGIATEGYEALENPPGNSVINGLRIGSVMRTDELGAIDAVWRLGGTKITSSGAQVAWGFFHADPELLAWGSRENPDVFVKVWFDVTGRIDVNFFHVSVPDIEVYSDFPEDGLYDQKGVTIMSDRYVRHEYSR